MCARLDVDVAARRHRDVRFAVDGDAALAEHDRVAAAVLDGDRSGLVVELNQVATRRLDLDDLVFVVESDFELGAGDDGLVVVLLVRRIGGGATLSGDAGGGYSGAGG